MKIQNKKNLTFIGSTIIAIALIIVFVIFPIYRNINELKKKDYDQRLELESLLRQDANSSSNQKEYEALLKKIDKINKVIIKKDDILSFITALENLAEQYNLTQDFNLPSEINTPTTEMQEINLNFTVSGTFLNLINYLQEIESQEFYLNIERVSLSTGGTATATGESTGSVIVTMNFSTKSYWQ